MNMKIIIVDEIMDISPSVVTRPTYIVAKSINGFKSSQYAGVVEATQIMLQNDCIWVRDTPEDIVLKLNSRNG
jgi:hypothetical protein